jgi:hypothetical protein
MQPADQSRGGASGVRNREGRIRNRPDVAGPCSQEGEKDRANAAAAFHRVAAEADFERRVADHRDKREARQRRAARPDDAA